MRVYPKIQNYVRKRPDEEAINREFLPTNGLSIKPDGSFFYKSEVIKSTQNKGNPWYSSTSSIILRNKEDDIYSRIPKALDHLATFCPKKKETF